MSLVKVAGNASGTGTITIQAPNTNTNYTLDLPAAAGTIQLSGNAISGTTGTFSGTISGGSTIGVGGATPANTGAGITFPATQSASSDANTLDDYEEGTFTPTVLGSSTAGTSTYTIQNGNYTKVGRSVIFRLRVAISAATGTGNLQIGGLPFSSADQTGVSIGFANVLALGANNVATAFASGSVIEMYQYPIGGGLGSTVGMDTAFDIIIAGVYQT